MTSINKTGVVYSDYRASVSNGRTTPIIEEGEGWVKGWLVDTPGRDIVIVAKHSGPSTSPPTNLVRFYRKNGKSITRNIVAVDTLEFPMGAERSPGDRQGGDIAVCRLDKLLPPWVQAYKFADNPKREATVHTITQQWISTARLNFHTDPWAITSNRSDELIAGDSGLPWFIEEEGEWRVVSHTTHGAWGEGPLYSHKGIKKKLNQSIRALSDRSIH